MNKILTGTRKTFEQGEQVVGSQDRWAMLATLVFAAGTLMMATAPSPGAAVCHYVGALATPRDYHTATLLTDGRVLIAGGGNSSIPFYLSNVELYDPAIGQVSVIPAMNTARLGHSATLLHNGQVLV